MNLLSLEYFLVAAEELNFTRAANRLYIAQQSLSGHIRKLEDYFGCPLFDRSSPLSLTKEGIALERAARRLLASAADVERELQDVKDMRNGELIIGITRTRGNIYLPPILTKFSEKYPYIRITIFEGNSSEAETALHRAQIDLLIDFVPLDIQHIKSIPFWQENTVIVVPRCILSNYFPSNADEIIAGEKTLTLRDIRHCPIISLDSTTRAGYAFQEACNREGFVPKIVVSAKSLSTLVPLCLNGMGILICPEIFLFPYRSMMGPRENPDILVFPADEVTAPRNICINYLTNKYLSMAAKGFIRILERETSCLNWKLF